MNNEREQILKNLYRMKEFVELQEGTIESIQLASTKEDGTQVTKEVPVDEFLERVNSQIEKLEKERKDDYLQKHTSEPKFAFVSQPMNGSSASFLEKEREPVIKKTNRARLYGNRFHH